MAGHGAGGQRRRGGHSHAVVDLLVVKNQIYGEALLAWRWSPPWCIWLAKPIPQMGISVPIFIPPIISALVAMLLSRDYAAPLAYVSGCMGTLMGADLLNLGELARLGASIASIGGAGTFDGVFLTGILAVLLAARPGGAPRRAARHSASVPRSCGLTARAIHPPQRPAVIGRTSCEGAMKEEGRQAARPSFVMHLGCQITAIA